MALDPVIDTLDGLHELIRKEYRKGTAEEGLEGKFVLDVKSHPSGWGLEPVVGLKNTLSKIKGERDQLKKKLDLFGEVEPESIVALRTELEELKKLKDDSPQKVKAQIEAQVQEVKKKLDLEIAERDGRIKKRDQAIERLLIDSVSTQALQKFGGDPLLLLPHIRDQVKVVWENEQPIAQVIDPKNPATVRVTLKQGSTEHMPVDELVELMSKDDRYKRAFAGSGAAGTGTTGTRNGTGGGANGNRNSTVLQNQDGQELSPVERLKQYHREKTSVGRA